MKVRDLDILPVCIYIVKPVLRGHIWDKTKWSFKTGDLLKEVKFI